MRALLLLGIGATFTALLLLVPAMHTASWAGMSWSAGTTAVLTLPAVVLLIAVIHPEPWLTLCAFPVAHLPAVALEPSLTGRLVYSGEAGLLALIAVAAVGCAWFVVALGLRSGGTPPALPKREPPEGPPEAGTLLAPVALLLSLAYFAAFAAAALGSKDGDPLAASVTLIASVAVIWYAVGQVLVGRLAPLLYDASARRRAMGSLYVEQPRKPLAIWGLAVLVGVALSVILVWYLA